LLILLLSAGLTAAAFFTRPSKANVDAFVAAQEKKQPFLDRLFHHHQYVMKDRYLWVDVECDGKLAYRGAFAHFFKKGEAEAGGK
jgi:hypothetical protein